MERKYILCTLVTKRTTVSCDFKECRMCKNSNIELTWLVFDYSKRNNGACDIIWYDTNEKMRFSDKTLSQYIMEGFTISHYIFIASVEHIITQADKTDCRSTSVTATGIIHARDIDHTNSSIHLILSKSRWLPHISRCGLYWTCINLWLQFIMWSSR